MLNPINKTIELGDGRTITIETGKLAKQSGYRSYEQHRVARHCLCR